MSGPDLAEYSEKKTGDMVKLLGELHKEGIKIT